MRLLPKFEIVFLIFPKSNGALTVFPKIAVSQPSHASRFPFSLKQHHFHILFFGLIHLLVSIYCCRFFPNDHNTDSKQNINIFSVNYKWLGQRVKKRIWISRKRFLQEGRLYLVPLIPWRYHYCFYSSCCLLYCRQLIPLHLQATDSQHRISNLSIKGHYWHILLHSIQRNIRMKNHRNEESLKITKWPWSGS